MDYAGRIQKLQAILRRKKIDAILIGQPENRRYLCGYSTRDQSIGESSGTLLICARGKNYLLTDFRYEIQAEQEVKQATVLLYHKGPTPLVKKMARKLNLKRIGFEPHYMLYASALKLMASCRGKDVEFIPTTELVEKMRLIKDDTEIDRIRKSVHLNEKVFQEVKVTLEHQAQVVLRKQGQHLPGIHYHHPFGIGHRGTPYHLGS